MIFSNIEQFSDPGAHYNEDAFFAGDTCLVVVDGATGLDKKHYSQFPTDAGWLASRAVELIGEKAFDSSAPLSVICLQAALQLREEYQQMGGDPDAAEGAPSASLAIARITPDELEIYTLGDVTSIVKMANGNVDYYRDTNLGNLDQIAIDAMVELAQQSGESVAAQRPKIQDILVRHRALRNKPGGYYSFDTSAAGADKGHLSRWDLYSVQELALLSDGLADSVPLYGMYADYAALLQAARSSGFGAVCNALRVLQNEDPDYNEYPRFKAGDDATGIAACLAE